MCIEILKDMFTRTDKQHLHLHKESEKSRTKRGYKAGVHHLARAVYGNTGEHIQVH